MPASQSTDLRLPCVVQLGFAGSRHLLASESLSAGTESELLQLLCGILRKLPEKLQLAPQYFFCGISQLAIGGDTVFTRACAMEGIPQRLFLPQPRDVFFSAVGSGGTPDFTDQERRVAEELSASPHIIQERVVSDAADRETRFTDANLEILRVSDVVVALLGENDSTKPGGTGDFIRSAIEDRKPTLELRLTLDGASPRLQETWHNLDRCRNLPKLPEEVAGLTMPVQTNRDLLPTDTEFCREVRNHTGRESAKHQNTFARNARIIIGTHIFATLCAALALALHGLFSTHDELSVPPYGLIGLLAFETVLLGWGFATHKRLHQVESNVDWALNRLLTEINRSVTQIGQIHMYLDYLFRLKLPSRIRPLIRTINVLHLRTTRTSSESWETLREKYLRQRLTDPESGQIAYYEHRFEREKRLLVLFRRLFQICSLLAITATVAKIVVLCELLPASEEAEPIITGLLGLFAIVLPVMAVGFISWSAAMDYQARVTTYEEMAAWLRIQCNQLKQAGSQREFERLVSETEWRLIGETAEWYHRRSFTAVT